MTVLFVSNESSVIDDTDKIMWPSSDFSDCTCSWRRSGVSEWYCDWSRCKRCEESRSCNE